MDSDVKTDKVWLLNVQKKLYQWSRDNYPTTLWSLESRMHSERCMSGSERGYGKPTTERPHGACNLLLPVHSHGKRVLLPCCCHGLGKQEGIVLEIIEYLRCLILHRGP